MAAVKSKSKTPHNDDDFGGWYRSHDFGGWFRWQVAKGAVVQNMSPEPVTLREAVIEAWRIYKEADVVSVVCYHPAWGYFARPIGPAVKGEGTCAYVQLTDTGPKDLWERCKVAAKKHLKKSL